MIPTPQGIEIIAKRGDTGARRSELIVKRIDIIPLSIDLGPRWGEIIKTKTYDSRRQAVFV